MNKKALLEAIVNTYAPEDIKNRLEEIKELEKEKRVIQCNIVENENAIYSMLLIKDEKAV